MFVLFIFKWIWIFKSEYLMFLKGYPNHVLTLNWKNNILVLDYVTRLSHMCKMEAPILNTFTIVLTSIVLCVPLMIIELYFIIYYGMVSPIVNNTPLIKWKFVVDWGRFSLRMHSLLFEAYNFDQKNRQKWVKACKNASICLQKLKTPMKFV
jgi:hypothetical protein